jgi:hypothetical protein
MTNFMDWVAEASEKFGLTEEDWKELKKAAILTFVEEGDKIKSTYNGAHVFRHRDSESTIKGGETWICSLDDKKTYFFAKGLQRVDSSFMFELKKDQVDEMASMTWEKYRHILEPGLEEKYKEVMLKNIAQAVEEKSQEYEDRIKTLNESIRLLEQKDTENTNIISSLHEKLNAAESGKKATPVTDDAYGIPEYRPPVTAAVRRDAPDTISSESFNKSRYFVHLSADHRVIVIRAHEQGNVVCMNNTIILEGLSLISSFTKPYDMISEYDHARGGIRIHL